MPPLLCPPESGVKGKWSVALRATNNNKPWCVKRGGNFGLLWDVPAYDDQTGLLSP